MYYQWMDRGVQRQKAKLQKFKLLIILDQRRNLRGRQCFNFFSQESIFNIHHQIKFWIHCPLEVFLLCSSNKICRKKYNSFSNISYFNAVQFLCFWYWFDHNRFNTFIVWAKYIIQNYKRKFVRTLIMKKKKSRGSAHFFFPPSSIWSLSHTFCFIRDWLLWDMNKNWWQKRVPSLNVTSSEFRFHTSIIPSSNLLELSTSPINSQAYPTTTLGSIHNNLFPPIRKSQKPCNCFESPKPQISWRRIICFSLFTSQRRKT